MKRPPRSRRRPLAAERLEARALLAVTPALLDSWFVSGQGEFAQIYAGQPGGTVVGPSTTWTSQSSPVIGDVQKVSFSNATDTVYINTPDLASYVMGAWWGNAAQTQPFQNLPKDQNATYKITLNTTYPSAIHSTAGGGAVGIAVNGVVFYNAGDAFSYSHANASEMTGGDGLFNRLAAAVESVTFDAGNGHQPGNGQYHYHEDPVALRAQLGDNIDYVGTTNYFPYDPGVYYLTQGQGADGDFREHATNLHHSPIIGWMFDGHPIYGPYGYSNPTDPTSTVARMRSSFSVRNITERSTLPGWAAALAGNKLGATAAATPADGTYTMTLAQQGQYAGPAVSATYPLGRYGEDYAYVTGAGDLDQFNGRWCKTPEFPNGTYAYFVTIDGVGEPAFPYVVNRQFYGQANGSGKVTSITEPVTVSFDVATNVAPVVSGPAAFAVTQSATLPLTNALRVAVSDVDAAAVESVALAVSAGTLGLDLTGILSSRVTVVSGANNSAAISISGALDELNAALATLTYTAPATGSTATLTAQANDRAAANNLSSPLTVSITLTSNGPAAPTFALAADTGSSATDGVTSNGQIDVSGLEAGATWESSTDSGASWSAGTGTSFTLAAGTYSPAAIQVRQTSVGGVTSPAASNPQVIVVDTVAPSATIGRSGTGTLTVGASETLTFTLSEPSTTFSGVDVTVTGGTISGFSGTGDSYTATFTPAPDFRGRASIAIAVGTFADAAGNPNLAGGPLTMDVDTVAPTVAIARVGTGTLKIGDTDTLMFTISEPGNGFTAADVTIVGGSISNFSGSGGSYSATFSPAASFAGSATVSIAAGAFFSLAGNANVAASFRVPVDTAPPTLTIVRAGSGTLRVGTTDTITFTLSEPLTNFASDAVTVTGGTLTNFSGSGVDYSATFTPAAAFEGTASVSVAGGTFVDGVGYPNLAAGPLLIPVDTVAPLVAIGRSGTRTLTIGSTETITFTLSESSTNFTIADVSVTGGTLSSFSGSGTTYSARYTPDANFTGTGTVSVAAGAFTDRALNGNLAAGPLGIPVDTAAPVIVRFSSPTPFTTVGIGGSVVIVAEFSEQVTTGGLVLVQLDSGASLQLVVDATGLTARGTSVVQPGEMADDLDVVAIVSIGPVADAAGNVLVDSSPAPGFGLADQCGIIVDGAVKVVDSGDFSTNPAIVWDVKARFRQIPIRFSTPVTGVTARSFIVYQNESPIPMHGATLSGSGLQYTLSLPASRARPLGLYRLDIAAASGIQATANGAAASTVSSIRWGHGRSLGVLPDAPAALTVTPSAPSRRSYAATLAWSTPSGNAGGAVIDYMVEYRAVGGATWLRLRRTVPAATTSATIQGLAAGRGYEFRVTARNAFGLGASALVATASESRSRRG